MQKQRTEKNKRAGKDVWEMKFMIHASFSMSGNTMTHLWGDDLTGVFSGGLQVNNTENETAEKGGSHRKICTGNS